MTVSVSDPGRLVQATIPRSGRPTLRRLSNDQRLKTADGLAYDNRGRLWIIVNGVWSQDPKNPDVYRGSHQYLLTRTNDGKLHTVAANPSWLNYGTMLAFTSHTTHQLMYLSNGGFYGGPVNVLRLQTG
jgi:hypothetical protein